MEIGLLPLEAPKQQAKLDKRFRTDIHNNIMGREERVRRVFFKTVNHKAAHSDIQGERLKVHPFDFDFSPCQLRQILFYLLLKNLPKPSRAGHAKDNGDDDKNN